MKMMAGVISLMTLYGCSTPSGEGRSGSFSEYTRKSPQEYVTCLEPKWQAVNISTSKTRTRSGFSLEASAPQSGPVALAIIDAQESGSRVEVFLPTAQGRAETWGDRARSCL
ncbi:hypothetical protein I5L34_33285 [Pseudomonas aeruginosa]|uniref:hypothetical protein n=1 Tax=Pseudomonas aeruginosa TaxID=287 RepID=UPI0012D9240B|nr:hypothetical protein [Pseudomonas aeruginosa]MBH9468149.1 hypothetical protein [Pseudomonas aeruginosa]MUI50051.1 hypothetical protein [Pseudomonas aeruginosa]HCL3820753.1 hypothetical protein [Pseudomonas aeruginosa]